ncbi:low molecular weight phosphotyrosine protein phosphatase [Rhizobiales bacterium]|uniref:low molecular weight protein-tyrosine-phosphatase n=1 Tax=Hongsoonwoonella zoysiae TaxID=2821844 RepID=UPI001560641A|nr:low molecular weight protein-tyrosine-phosphatase [Hongsoonwoonella zoysiae]NRG17065.1 low molecular weight phosphotyrosine protein phosphatase [Hongsoonwoonella zoysiae]
MYSVLFVCLGNICRSPLAEGIFRHEAKAAGLGRGVVADSAGTGAWHIGKPPDPRSIDIARLNGIDIAGLRARQVKADDFSRFELILAMDGSNLTDLERLRPANAKAELRRFLASDVPDPYYGGNDGFASVYRMVRDGSLALIDEIRARGGFAAG